MLNDYYNTNWEIKCALCHNVDFILRLSTILMYLHDTPVYVLHRIRSYIKLQRFDTPNLYYLRFHVFTCHSRVVVFLI